MTSATGALATPFSHVTPETEKTGTPEPVTQQRKPFQPKGDVARWRVLYARMQQLEPGELLHWEEMGQLLDLDFIDQRQVINGAARRAAKEMEQTDRIVLALVHGHGYERAKATEVLKLAHRHQKRAAREVKAGVSKVEAVDPSTLDPTTRRLFEATAISFRQQEQMMKRLDVRQNRIEDAMVLLGAQQEKTASQVEEIAPQLTETQRKIQEMEAALAELKTKTDSTT